MLPIKASVRKAEKLDEGNLITVRSRASRKSDPNLANARRTAMMEDEDLALETSRFDNCS